MVKVDIIEVNYHYCMCEQWMHRACKSLEVCGVLLGQAGCIGGCRFSWFCDCFLTVQCMCTYYKCLLHFFLSSFSMLWLNIVSLIIIGLGTSLAIVPGFGLICDAARWVEYFSASYCSYRCTTCTSQSTFVNRIVWHTCIWLYIMHCSRLPHGNICVVVRTP